MILLEKIRLWTVIAALGTAAYSYFIPDKITTHIIDAEKSMYHPDKYVIFTNQGSFEEDRLKQGLSKLVGKEVEITKYGWRINFLDMHEQVKDIREVQKR